MRAELLRQLGAVVAPVDRNDLKAHAARVLHAEVTQSAYAEHRDEVASARRRVAQPAGLGDHHLGVAAVVLHAGVALVHAVHEVAIAAVFTVAAGTAEEADADPLADGPAFNPLADDVDASDRFVARHPRPPDRQDTLNRRGIRMAHPTGLDADPDMTRRRIKQRLFGQLQLAWAYRVHRSIG